MKANNPIASVKANDNIDKPNNVDCKLGFLAVPFINALNTIPAPIAAPPNAIVDIPAAINFNPSILLIFIFIN